MDLIQILDIIYDTAVQIFDDRYQAEFSIPFSSLRYSLADIQTWRISFGRLFTTPDMQGHFVHWANQIDGIECQTCQLGFLKRSRCSSTILERNRIYSINCWWLFGR